MAGGIGGGVGVGGQIGFMPCSEQEHSPDVGAQKEQLLSEYNCGRDSKRGLTYGSKDKLLPQQQAY